MTTEEIAVIHTLSLLRQYCAKEQTAVDQLSKNLLKEYEHPKNMKKDTRTDYDNYEGMSTAYFDVTQKIESLIITAVTDE